MEKAVDMVLDDARTTTNYGRQNPTKQERNLSEDVVYRFRQMLLRQRLDAKSFFQDWDKHRHFKITPKQFRQVLANFGFTLNDDEIVSLVRNYGNEAGEIQYKRFLEDSDPAKGRE